MEKGARARRFDDCLFIFEMKFKVFQRQLRRMTTRLRSGLIRVMRHQRAPLASLVAIIAALVVATRPSGARLPTPLAFHQEADFPVLTAERLAFDPGPSNQARRLAKATAKPSTAYRVTQALASRSRPHFYQVLVPLYRQAEETYGVDPKLLAAIHYVESGLTGDTTVRSSAGAQGPMQFMPPTFRAYAVDGDGDGSARITDLEDSIMTAANYLAANGAADGQIDHALYRYNHSKLYVAKVKKIANDVQL